MERNSTFIRRRVKSEAVLSNDPGTRGSVPEYFLHNPVKLQALLPALLSSETETPSKNI